MFRPKEKDKLQNASSARKRTSYKKTQAKENRNKTKKEEKEKEKSALSSIDLVSMLKNQDNFIGVFAADELKNLSICKFPAFLVVNIMDRNYLQGHWISLRIDRQNIEIFDSLGCEPTNWGHYPLALFKFLNSYSHSHSFTVSPLLQPAYSHLCGFYCVFYILGRQNRTFRKLLKIFSRDLDRNDEILCTQLNKMLG